MSASPEIQPILFSSALNLEQVTTEDVIAIANKQELHDFEDSLVEALLPSMFDDELARWAHRHYLADQLLPKGSYGRLTDIRIQLVADAYDKMVEQDPKFKRKDIEQARKDTIGFHIGATVMSTSVATSGELGAIAWVYRITPTNIQTVGEYGRRVANDREKAAKIEKSIRETRKATAAVGVVSSGTKTFRRGTLHSESPNSKSSH